MSEVLCENIIQVPRERLAEALPEVMSHGLEAGAADRFLAFLRCQGLEADQCWAVEDQAGRLGPTFLALPNAGRTAMVFITSPRTPGEVPRLARLIEHAHQRLDRARIALAQALLETGELLHVKAFERARYTRLATLQYLERRLGRIKASPAPDWPEEVTLLEYRPEREGLFKEALAESYVDTLDCPALCGLRDIEDVFRDHRGQGVQDAELWTLVLWKGRPAAVMLLNPLADGESVELSYLGVGATFRKRGLARRLMALAMRRLSDRRFRRFTLAVDDRNQPALALYRSFGLACTDRRLAYIRPVPDEGDGMQCGRLRAYDSCS